MLTKNRILAIDDNPIHLAVLEEAFQDQYTLRVTTDPHESLRIASEFAPDVILLDVMMPGVDGFNVCGQIKNDPSLRQCQVIMVSARSNLDDRLRAYQAGADDYLCKPFDEEELSAKVAAAVRPVKLCRAAATDFDALCGATSGVLELIVHLRDSDSVEHLDSVRLYARLIAEEYSALAGTSLIDAQFLDALDRASALYDIGNIAVPDAILRKPGRLTEEERAVVERHTVIGEQILRRLSLRQDQPGVFEVAAQVARSHHERFDGGGYPDGLSGEAIPLAARIVKVADVFDALTTDRAFKLGYDPAYARGYIVAASDSQFDPQVVKAMLRAYDAIFSVCRSLERPSSSRTDTHPLENN